MSPEEAGLAETGLADAQLEVNTGTLAGAVGLVWQGGHIRSVGAVGVRDLATGQPMQPDTLFRVASLTKPVTAMAALQLMDEGRFQLDDPIAPFAPELARPTVLPRPDAPLHAAVPADRGITFRDLLTHRAGLSYADFLTGPVTEAYTTLGPQLDNPLSPDDWLARLGRIPLLDEPGQHFRYGHASDVLGIVLARMEGTSLAELLQRRIFEPLGMVDTGFDVPPDKHHRRAGLCGFDDDGALAPLSATPGGHAMAERPAHFTFQSGGQGLWSTAADYARFAASLLGHTPLLRPDTLRLMRENQLSPNQRAEASLFGMPLFSAHGYGMGLAVVLDPAHADPMRGRGGVGTLGWPGAFGSWWQADPTTDSVLVFLSHSMPTLDQMALGIGLGSWAAIAGFHAAATRGQRSPSPPS
jgi:CubicO group peptidase (beta-lactamase class C family)